jgi:ribosomal protein S18 acetylase RimI-like enzyme
MHTALEAWARDNGARWMRLGVVCGNARGERFWEKSGYVEVRRRENFAAGQRLTRLRMMVKLPPDGDLSEYLGRVPRDLPESP